MSGSDELMPWPQQIRAAARMLLDAGDITPAGARVLEVIAEQWEEEQA